MKVRTLFFLVSLFSLHSAYAGVMLEAGPVKTYLKDAVESLDLTYKPDSYRASLGLKPDSVAEETFICSLLGSEFAEFEHASMKYQSGSGPSEDLIILAQVRFSAN